MKMKKFPAVMCAVVLAGILSATTFEPQGNSGAKKTDKQSDKDKSKDKDKDKAKSESGKDEDAPKPLFQGSLGIKSSRQGKDSAALGFNGLDPEGKIEKAALDAPVTKIDAVNAASLVAFNPTADELKQFMSEGNLKAGAGPTATTDKKKK
jgi:hypothetical protein